MTDWSDTRRRLEARLRRLEDRVSRIERDLRKPTDPDSQERATEAENDEVLERLDEAEGREIEDIRRALGKLDAGTYGTCEVCGDPIASGRLEALPFATHCIDCAS